MYYIFRKSDRVLLYTPDSIQQLDNEYKACLLNEGGLRLDYLVLESDEVKQKGFIATYNDDNKVIFIEILKVKEKRERKEVAKNKLKGLLPGLTDEDIKDLGL